MAVDEAIDLKELFVVAGKFERIATLAAFARRRGAARSGVTSAKRQPDRPLLDFANARESGCGREATSWARWIARADGDRKCYAGDRHPAGVGPTAGLTFLKPQPVGELTWQIPKLLRLNSAGCHALSEPRPEVAMPVGIAGLIEPELRAVP